MSTFEDARKKYLDVLYLLDKKKAMPHHRMTLNIISDELEVAKNNPNLVDFENIIKRLEDVEAGMN